MTTQEPLITGESARGAPRRLAWAHELRTILFIALRQLWARKLLNGIAVGGITLGVMTLVTMNGIMQGFEQKFTQSILKISPHVTLNNTELLPDAPLLNRYANRLVAARVAHQTPSDRQGRIKRPQDIVRSLRQLPDVEAAAASLAGMVLVEYGGKTRSIDLRGIEIAEQEKVTPITQYTQTGSLTTLALLSHCVESA